MFEPSIEQIKMVLVVGRIVQGTIMGIVVAIKQIATFLGVRGRRGSWNYCWSLYWISCTLGVSSFGFGRVLCGA